MKGHTVRAVSLEFSPFLTYSLQDSGVIIPKDSLDWRMVSTIAQILNFKVEDWFDSSIGLRVTERI